MAERSAASPAQTTPPQKRPAAPRKRPAARPARASPLHQRFFTFARPRARTAPVPDSVSPESESDIPPPRRVPEVSSNRSSPVQSSAPNSVQPSPVAASGNESESEYADASSPDSVSESARTSSSRARSPPVDPSTSLASRTNRRRRAAGPAGPSAPAPSRKERAAQTREEANRGMAAKKAASKALLRAAAKVKPRPPPPAQIDSLLRPWTHPAHKVQATAERRPNWHKLRDLMLKPRSKATGGGRGAPRKAGMDQLDAAARSLMEQSTAVDNQVAESFDAGPCCTVPCDPDRPQKGRPGRYIESAIAADGTTSRL